MRADDQQFTYADLLTWPENERWELIDGFAYDMTPAPSPRHQEIVMALSAQFYQFLEGKPCRVFPAPFDVRLPTPGEDDMTATSVVQPDITVVCDREKLDARGCLGSPTLMVEVLSPETAKKDMREKLHVYERAGVPEYWIVSPFEQTLMVFTLDAAGRYGAPTVYDHDDQAPVGVLEGLRIDMPRVFAE
jgi:Uma2 family endonuclease